MAAARRGATLLDGRFEVVGRLGQGSTAAARAHVARGIRAVLCGADPAGVELSGRAKHRLEQNRAEHRWAEAGATTIVRDPSGKAHW